MAEDWRLTSRSWGTGILRWRCPWKQSPGFKTGFGKTKTDFKSRWLHPSFYSVNAWIPSWRRCSPPRKKTKTNYGYFVAGPARTSRQRLDFFLHPAHPCLNVTGAAGPSWAVARPLDSQRHSQRITRRLAGRRVSAAPNLSETPTNPTRQGETEDVG